MDLMVLRDAKRTQRSRVIDRDPDRERNFAETSRGKIRLGHTKEKENRLTSEDKTSQGLILVYYSIDSLKKITGL